MNKEPFEVAVTYNLSDGLVVCRLEDHTELVIDSYYLKGPPHQLEFTVVEYAGNVMIRTDYELEYRPNAFVARPMRSTYNRIFERDYV